MKICFRCKVSKPSSEFHKDKFKKDGLKSTCKACYSIAYSNTKGKYKDRARKNYLANRERILASNMQWKYKNRYNITIEQKKQRIAEQNGKCAICRTPIDFSSAAVDHNHITKSIRGLLCDNCNVGLGNFKDDPQILRDAAEYLVLRTF
jgi:Recombination endonuclease VII